MMTRKTGLMMIAAAAVAVFAVSGSSDAKQRSAQDQALWEKARADCNSPKWPNGATPSVNYKRGTYVCIEPRESSR